MFLNIYSFGLLLMFLLSIRCNVDNNEVIIRENSSVLRGISVFIIMGSHITLRLNNLGIMYIYQLTAYLAVSLFFMFSAYGLLISYTSKENYLKGFIIDKFSKVLIPIFTLNVLAFFIYTLGFKKDFEIMDIMLNTISVKTLGNNFYMWFFCVLLVFYLLFYCVLNIFKLKKGVYIISMVIIAYCIYGNIIGIPDYWYNSAVGFLVGMLLAYNKEHILKLTRSRIWIIGIISLIVFLILFMLGMLQSSFIVEFKIGASLALCIFITAFNRLIVIKNKILAYFGGASLEMYLVHRFLLDLFESNKYLEKVSHQFIYFFVTIILCILFRRICISLLKMISNFNKAYNYKLVKS